MQKFEPFNTLILRSPNFSIDHLKNLDKKNILAFYSTPSVKEALLLASSSLFSTLNQFNSGELTEKKKTDNLFFSLTKYMLRMTSRCTPFGLFASCSLITLGATTDIGLHPDKKIKRHVRLDNGYLTQLINVISNDKGIRYKLKYFPNSTLYKQGYKWRYVEFDYVNNERIHKISSFQNEDYFEMIFNKLTNGFYINELADLLKENFLIIQDETYEFVDKLIDSQIIVSELLINVTGEDYLIKTIKTLTRYNENKWKPTLSNVKRFLKTINSTSIGTNINIYDDITNELNKIQVPFEKKTLFQVDTFKPIAGAIISSEIIQKVKQAVEFLSRFTTAPNKNNLEAFATAFTTKYEQREIPLVLALDPEAGIGYKQNIANGDVAPLVDDLVTKEKSPTQIEVTSLFQLLYPKLIDALINKQNEVKIYDNDLKDFPVKLDKLPDTFAIMVSILSHKMDADNSEEFQILINNSVFINGGKLIGRFCHLDKSVEDLCRDIAKKETDLNQNCVIAEVVHIPEGRVGNILFRPYLREFEIPYLASSSVEHDFQIHVSDLMVSVRNGKVILRSQKLNKIVIPKSTNAHNYSNNSLPVYHFLNDIQYQDIAPINNFNWGGLQSINKFLPRITYKSTILSPAQWNLAQDDFKDLLASSEEYLLSNFNKICSSHNIPRFTLVEEGDNRLFIDAENLLIVKTFKNFIQKRKRLVLIEFLFDMDNAFLKHQELDFTNELIIPFYRTNINDFSINAEYNYENIKRSFIPGDNWNYLKIYTGYKQADEILLNIIAPIIYKFRDQGKIKLWFFIRYSDPAPHLRIRFFCSQSKDSFEILQAFNCAFQAYIENDIIHKIQFDTYQKELERYHPDFIEKAEMLFYHDSECIVNMISNPEMSDELRWQLALLNVNYLLDDFGLDIQKKSILLNNLSQGYKKEFDIKPTELKFFSEKFRANKIKINSIMSKTNQDTDIEVFYKLLDARSYLNAKIIKDKKYEIPEDIISSLIHMSINRLFRSKQRLHELIIYDFLSLYYKQEILKLK